MAKLMDASMTFRLCGYGPEDRLSPRVGGAFKACRVTSGLTFLGWAALGRLGHCRLNLGSENGEADSPSVRQATQMRQRCIVVSLIAILVASCWEVHASELLVLALRGEGSASLLIDQEAQIAVLTDGGLNGQRGILGARVEDRAVLSYLKDSGVDRLIISCTHPHRDHIGGLKPVLCEDATLLSFRQLVLIDTPESLGTATPLADILRQCRPDIEIKSDLPKDDAYFGLAVAHVSAVDADAFALLADWNNGVAWSKNVEVSNYRYLPTEVGSEAHDRTIITRYRVGNQLVVDFDDASSRLLAHWAAKYRGPSPTAVLVPHHGSRKNNLEPVLAANSSIRQAIITVNADNRYDHPDPDVLNQLIERLGPDNVFLTGSQTGRNLRIEERGVSYTTGDLPESVLLAFLAERYLGLRDRLDPIERAVHSYAVGAGLAELAQSLARGQPLEEAGLALASKNGWVQPAQAAAARRAYPRLAATAESMVQVLKRSRVPEEDVVFVAAEETGIDLYLWPEVFRAAADHIGLATTTRRSTAAALLPIQVDDDLVAQLEIGLQQGPILGLAAIPAGSPSPSCAGLSEGPAKVACNLAEVWPAAVQSGEAMMVLVERKDLAHLLRLREELRHRGWQATLIGGDLTTGRGEILADVSLALEMMKITPTAVLETSISGAREAINACVAALTPRLKPSKQAKRFLELSKGGRSR